MTGTEIRSAAALASVFFLRMLGLFMILPVLPLHADALDGATPMLIGLALGGYGVSQALLQIPFGMLSDRWGRKRVITFGMLLFAAGGVVAGLSESIYGVILGRVLQGAGAVAAAVMALAADLTTEVHRTKAFAMIGSSIGLAFLLAFVFGPLIYSHHGLPAVFWAAAASGLAAIAILHAVVPDPPRSPHHRDCEADAGELARILGNGPLMRLNVGVFSLHFVLTASFVVLPLALRDQVGLDPGHHWALYLPVLIASVVLMIPFLWLAERRHQLKPVMVGGIALITLTEIAFAERAGGLAGIAALLVAFFTAFNLLEALLPSLVSRTAPLGAKGTALGVFSTAQFLGSFAGGALGGYLHGAVNDSMVHLAAAAVAAIWLIASATMPGQAMLRQQVIPIGALSPGAAAALRTRLVAIVGVADAVVVADEGVAYLLVDPERLDAVALRTATAVA